MIGWLEDCRQAEDFRKNRSGLDGKHCKFPKTAVLEGKAVSPAPENALDRLNASQI
jgi:hypothetical protein